MFNNWYRYTHKYRRIILSVQAKRLLFIGLESLLYRCTDKVSKVLLKTNSSNRWRNYENSLATSSVYLYICTDLIRGKFDEL